MCRILVFAIDQQPIRDDHWKRGDVVDVVEDGGEFGKAFDGNPSFRIIEMPGVPRDKYFYLTSPDTETITDPLGQQAIVPVRKTMFTIDIDGMEAKEQSSAGAKLTTIADADIKPAEKAPLPVKVEIIG